MGKKKINKKLISLAKEKEKRAYNADKMSHKGIRVTHGKLSKLYENAGDAWADARGYSKAFQLYKESMENAYNKHVKEKIQEKIEALPKINISEGFKGLEKKSIFAILSISFLLSAFFFASFSLTGYSVFELTQNNSRFIGTGLFILGFVFSFIYFKCKKCSP